MVTITAGMVHFQRTFLLAQLLRLLVVLVTGSGQHWRCGTTRADFRPRRCNKIPALQMARWRDNGDRVDGGGW
ncbi:hypothetical protein [Enterobacter phage 04_vB_Eclo_IJM]|nr:hypothetical protein [Enterobacter phage 04_vB_Eclo_IJM]